MRSGGVSPPLSEYFSILGKHSKKIEVALLTYDTTSVKYFGFCYITNKEIHDVNELVPNGPYTATYDAYKDCVEYLRKKGFEGAQERRNQYAYATTERKNK
jgi:hypothetical protein